MIWDITAASLFSAGSLIFITTGLLCAYVRWNHMCRPFNDDAGYFYPARKFVTFFYASIALTFPYALAPMDPAVWIYTRSFGVLYYPVCFAVMIRQYFQLHRRKAQRTFGKVYLATPFALLLTMLVPLLTGNEEWIFRHEKATLYVVGAISLVFTFVTVKVLMTLKKEMDRSNTENFSSEDDFPYKFASKVLYAPFLWILLMWIVFVTGSRWMKFFLDVFTSCWMTYFLCIILHPQRAMRPAEIETEIKRLEDRKQQIIQEINTEEVLEESAEDAQEDDGTPMNVIKDEVLTVILRRFREPHLLKTEVLMDLGKGKMNRASKFISQIGYYNLVNMFRLEYARLYKEAHPNAKQEEIALESGFVSRTAYYKAKRNVKEIDHGLTKGVTLVS